MESCGKNCKQLIGMLCVIIAQVQLGSLRFMTHKSKYLQFFSGMRSVLIEKYVKKLQEYVRIDVYSNNKCLNGNKNLSSIH